MYIDRMHHAVRHNRLLFYLRPTLTVSFAFLAEANAYTPTPQQKVPNWYYRHMSRFELVR